MRFYDLLLEANVLNNDEIKKYLDTESKDIPMPYKKQFVTAALKDIINNEEYHTRVTELPDDAPAWASKAMEAGPVYTASINPDQHERLTQILHWLQDIIAKSQNSSTDEKAVADKRDATKQLASLTRMTLADMKNQEEKWWSRDSHVVKGDVSGMEKVLDAGDGFSWWLLVTQDAFRREGQVLANCIGKNYTAASCQRSGAKIYILKDRAQESAVAMRVESGNEMAEVKGHNNRPPVARYIPYVNKFIQHENIKVGHGGNRDLNGAGYTYNPQTKSIQHITVAYPYEFGPELSNNHILGRWTAPGDMKWYGFQGYNQVGRSRGGERWDVVSKRNTYHPLLSFSVLNGQIESIGNLPNPKYAISTNGMMRYANALKEASEALKVSINPQLTGTLDQLGLNRYGIEVTPQGIKTDHLLGMDISVNAEPESIRTIKEPTERLQMVAVSKKPDVLTMIDNPSEEVQLRAFQVSHTVHALMNQFIESRDGKLPSDAVQIAAVSKDGLAIEKIIPASEAVQLAAVKNDGDSVVWIAYNHRKFKTPPPSVAVQHAAINQSPEALKFLFMMSIPVDLATKVYAVKRWQNASFGMGIVVDALNDFKQMTPELEKLTAENTTR